MSDISVELDLKFLPAWLKEAPVPNRYADFEGEPEGRAKGRDDFRGSGGFRSGERKGHRSEGQVSRPQGRSPGGDKPPFARDDRRGPRPKGHGGQGHRREQSRGRDDLGNGPRPQMPREPVRPTVRVEILPEPAAAAGIAKQIRSSARACGVFRVAKMFLERPERYRVKVTALAPDGILYQVGDGPVVSDPSLAERSAFRALRDRFYVEETVQGEAPKGIYTTVARDRFSGALLGPPNHHGYQAALRKLYEERYSRRVSWETFLRGIENVTDPAAVEQWKTQVSTSRIIKTRPPSEPKPAVEPAQVSGESETAVPYENSSERKSETASESHEASQVVETVLTFKTEAEAEAHFRAHHLPGLLRSGHSLEVSGTVAGSILDRSVGYAVRDAVEHERRVGIGMVNALRPYFHEAGLHLFKWKKKILFASAIRPQRHPAEQVFSEGISAILTTVAEKPGIKRPQLAALLLAGIDPESPDAVARKEALAADLHYLVHIGHVVEFQNGALELPPSRKEAVAADAGEDTRLDVRAEIAALQEPSAPPPSNNTAQSAREPQAPRARKERPPRRPKSRYQLLSAIGLNTIIPG